MTQANKKKLIQAIMIIVAAGLNVWGLLSLAQTTGADVGLTYISNISNLIARYVIVVITMAAGIMLMSSAAGTFKGKVKNVFSIVVCAYSTILTIPLFLTFILCIPIAAGGSLPSFIDEMVRDICLSFQDIFGTSAWQYVIYVLGTIMGAVFLAVPIMSTYFTVKDIDVVALLKSKIEKNIAEAQAEQPSEQKKLYAKDDTDALAETDEAETDKPAEENDEGKQE